MATETVASDHSPLPQQVEKEEVKKVEQEKVTPPKETEESLTPAAPSAVKETKVEEKQIEPPVKAEAEEKVEDKSVEPPTEEIKKIDDGPVVEPSVKDENAVEKSKTECDKNPEGESKVEIAEEKTKELLEIVDVPKSTPVEAVALAESEQKIEDKPVAQPPTKEIKIMEEATVTEPETAKIAEPTRGDIKGQSGKKPETGTAKKTEEAAEENPKETPEVVHGPKSIPVEAVEEKAEELHAKDVEVTKPEPISKEVSVDVQPTEKSEFVEQTEKEPPAEEPPKTDEVETPTDKAEECSDVVKSDIPATQVETKDLEISPAETTAVEKEEKEAVKETNASEAPSTEKVESGKIIETEPPKEVEDAASSISKPEVTEKEVTPRDTDPVAENGSKKDETIASAETCKEAVEEGKVHEEETKEAEKAEDKPKIEESIQKTEAEVEEEKHVTEAAKTDSGEKETSHEAPKQEVPVKTAQKQSNNLIKMVKQSLVKARKAITGKSTSSKTPASETKDDGKAK